MTSHPISPDQIYSLKVTYALVCDRINAPNVNASDYQRLASTRDTLAVLIAAAYS